MCAGDRGASGGGGQPNVHAAQEGRPGGQTNEEWVPKGESCGHRAAGQISLGSWKEWMAQRWRVKLRRATGCGSINRVCGRRAVSTWT